MLQTFLQTFRKGIFPKQKKEHVRFQLDPGTALDAENGFYQKGSAECMADFHFYRVNPGDRLVNHSRTYEYCLCTYSEEIEDRLIYTYCYQEEENWAKYRGDMEEYGWRSGDFAVAQQGWIRVAVRRTDKAELTDADVAAAAEALVLIRKKERYQEKPYFKEEIEETIRTVRKKREPDDLVFGLMTDSHFVINGGWEDSVANLQAVHGGVQFDAMIHLGDLTDGMTPLAITKEYTGRVMADLKSLEIPVYLTLGNHDSNYFRGNPEWMTEKEQSGYYLQREKPWYFVDYDRQKLRCLFLHSFNHKEEIRYGFPTEEVEWVRKTLRETPTGYCTLILSHVPLLPEMHFWSDKIRNSEELKRVLDEYVLAGGTILAYIHGHNHADQVAYTENFPIVAVGCAKCEDFKDRKPEGSVTYDRKIGTVSQELWDVMLVNTKKKKIDLVRFGAGEDRVIGWLKKRTEQDIIFQKAN